MFRIFTAVLSFAKRLDARLTNGVEMHGRCLTGLNKVRPVRHAAARNRPAPKHRPVTFAVH
ncbi:hypothetical protein D3C87_2198820 [compost metagenome]